MSLHTCVNTYAGKRDTWSKRYLFRSCPRDGIDLDLRYIDTMPSADNSVAQSSPTVLLVHGAPGSHADYASLIVRLSQDGVRVLAPTFPDVSYTIRTQTFRHTTEEKQELLHDFLTR